MAHILAKDLREAVLQAAIQGRLTEHLESDTPIEVTLKEIDEVKKQLIKEKKIKKEKLLSKITDDEIPFEAPDCWAKTRLQDCFYIHSAMRIHQSDWVKEGIPFLRGRELVKLAKTGRIESDVHITNELFQHLKTKGGVPQKNDILISAVGTLGKVYVVKGDEVFYYKDAYILCLDNYKLNPKFIKYLLESPYIQQLIYSDDAFGTTVAQLTISKMKNMPIILPPIEEQARIVAKVDEIMAKIDEYEKLENQLVKLKEQFPQDMKDSLLQAGMMGKLTEQYHSEHSPLRNLKNHTSEYDSDLPSNWSVAKMMTVSELYTGNSISESIKKSKYTGLSSGYNYVGTKDVGFDCSIAYNNGVKIPYDEPKFKIAKKHSTLLCIEGGSAGKKVGITSEDVCFGNKLCSFNAREYINYKFQFYVIQSPTFKKVFIQNKSGMIGGVSIKKLKEILIPLPPIEEQQRIVDKLDELLPLVDKLAELN